MTARRDTEIISHLISINILSLEGVMTGTGCIHPKVKNSGHWANRKEETYPLLFVSRVNGHSGQGACGSRR